MALSVPFRVRNWTRSRSHSHRSRINAARQHGQSFADVSDQQLADEANEIRNRSLDTETLSIQLAGLIAEAVRRRLGMRLHDVQMQAVLACDTKVILEMQTGEGKTLVTGSIAALRALCGERVHVCTTNPYLGARDFEFAQPIFETLGLSSGCLKENAPEPAARKTYRSDIVYGPGYQFGFDYLRDQILLRKTRPDQMGRTTAAKIAGRNLLKGLVQNGSFQTAIVDEADSVMIDEATTPLVISVPSSDESDLKGYLLAKKFIDELSIDKDYRVDRRSKVTIPEQTLQRSYDFISKVHDLALVRPWRVYIQNALRAKHELLRDVDYVVVDKQVQMVDQFTGRIQPDRSWQDGLHQAVEAKEGLQIQAGRDSAAQITRQRFLLQYERLIGLTGTASNSVREFERVYSCDVEPIPTHRKCLRKIATTRYFSDKTAKLTAIAQDVLRRHQQGQPILVGTRTIQQSYEVRDAIQTVGLNPILLNGVQDEEEAEIVGQAGISGSITIATNMAGRGTDIRPDEEALKAGGLHVVGVCPNQSQRIDRQLEGRSARQGQPGSCQFFAAADDELFTENAPSLARNMRQRANRQGESGNYTKHLIQLQSQLDEHGRRMREKMMLRDNWMRGVREAIEKD